MKFLVTGGDGQVGRALARRGAALGHAVVAVGRSALDVTDRGAVDRTIASWNGDAVINAAAYTAVDRAETERERAFAANRDGAANLAAACARRGLKLLHISTDYVFDGEKPIPYVEGDPVRPINAYGESKAAGEAAVRDLHPGAAIVRTSWVFGIDGPNFVRTILRLARERRVLQVVDDQRGCPTFADDLADALIDLAARAHVPPVLHFCGDGPTTWHAFAEAIVAGARARGPLACERVDAITTAERAAPARRPRSSVLDTSLARALGIASPAWRPGLDRMLDA
ncbi:MAG TPA: dTDP-4-dehydrorhamnose reductase [Haliangiales bacterium]|nr:dTDP-4-dehydrorhamnose reductase [Haliangiales bacterium]